MKKTVTLLALAGLALSSNAESNSQDEELFAAILAKAGVWALSHPQQITKGVEIGLKAAPTVIGGAKKAIDWIQHHDDGDDEFFLQDDEFYAQEDEELFAAVLAKAGVWALSHPQQITKGVEIGLKAAPTVIGGAQKAIDWLQHHDDDDDEFYAQEDEELFAAILAKAGVWALSHPQQITKGVEIGLKAAPTVIGGAQKAIDWIQHHDDDDELFVEKKVEVKPKKNGQKLRGGYHVEKSNLNQLSDLIKEGHRL